MTQQANGAPWYQRFGLDHNAPLSAALMPWYGQASNRLIRDAAMQALTQKLTVLANLPPRSPQRLPNLPTMPTKAKARPRYRWPTIGTRRKKPA